ncbi:50S ribosomal protein L31 [Candidatus Johnevansia muelleri]|uniref:50S ribosomal protein L31 n=1 Tax=Candidatus Johnevansia muelleri TaxID=1495769 RepID=A0A078KE69_9GAMM|nr:50S ribosomal protein L31 [Candidatus Evansia muelleri]
MKALIHPNYKIVTAICSCSAKFKVSTTKKIYIDVCSQCHSFYTGKNKKANIGGRIERFNKKFKY